MNILKKNITYRLVSARKQIDTLYQRMYTPGYDIYKGDMELGEFSDVFPEEGIRALEEYGPETVRQLIRLPFSEIRKVSRCSWKQLVGLMEAIITEFEG